MSSIFPDKTKGLADGRGQGLVGGKGELAGEHLLLSLIESCRMRLVAFRLAHMERDALVGRKQTLPLSHLD